LLHQAAVFVIIHEGRLSDQMCYLIMMKILEAADTETLLLATWN